jgi:hypothetical protein
MKADKFDSYDAGIVTLAIVCFYILTHILLEPSDKRLRRRVTNFSKLRVVTGRWVNFHLENLRDLLINTKLKLR